MRNTYIIVFCLIFFLFCFLISCTSNDKKYLKEGEDLAKIHCASCHLFPEPSLLDKKSWSNVLPKMTELMNVRAYFNPFDNTEEHEDTPEARVMPANEFPEDDWDKIYNYYYTSAPDQPLKRDIGMAKISMEFNIFKPHIVGGKFDNPLTTFVQIDEEYSSFWFTDAAAGKLYQLNDRFEFTDSALVQQGVVAVQKSEDKIYVLSMGILKLSDKKLGKLLEISSDNRSKIILDSLNRPVHFRFVDLNNDNRLDIIICEFGFRKGGLSWFENIGNNQYRQHYLRALPGNLKISGRRIPFQF